MLDARARADRHHPPLPGLPADARTVAVRAQPPRRHGARRVGRARCRTLARAVAHGSAATPARRRVRRAARRRPRHRIPARGPQDRLAACVPPHDRHLCRGGRSGRARVAARALGPRVRRRVRCAHRRGRRRRHRGGPPAARGSLRVVSRETRVRVRVLAPGEDAGAGGRRARRRERRCLAAASAPARVLRGPCAAAVHHVPPRAGRAVQPAARRGSTPPRVAGAAAAARRACDATRTLGRRLRPLRNVRSRLLGRDIGAPPRQSVSAAFTQARCHPHVGASTAAGHDARGRSRTHRRSLRRRRRLPVHGLRTMHRSLSGGARPGRPLGRWSARSGSRRAASACRVGARTSRDRVGGVTGLRR